MIVRLVTRGGLDPAGQPDQQRMLNLEACRSRTVPRGEHRPTLDPAAAARLARGDSATQTAKALGVSRATLYRHTDIVTTRAKAE